VLAREEGLVDHVQPDCHILIAPVPRRFGLPIFPRRFMEELKAGSRHSRVLVLTEMREHLPLHLQHRDRPLEDYLSD
jgi:hypothetical protein